MEEKKPAAALISFTERGGRLNRRLAEELEKKGYACTSYEKRGSGGGGLLAAEGSAGQWAGQRFSDTEHIIFVGAMGIAIRSIAPWIQDKWTDPSVTVIDERGTFVIPVLSGHAGGGNRLALEAAAVLGAVPVITTATDINRLFAVDVFAVKNSLGIADRTGAKEISAHILSGGKAGVFSDYPVEGIWPEELTYDKRQKKNFWITRRRGQYPWGKPGEQQGRDDSGRMLKLVPKVIHVGIGCRKDMPGQAVEEAVFQVLRQQDCMEEAVAGIASIDLKKHEPGLLGLAEKLSVPFRTYESSALAGLEGEFQESSFVARITGVGNVCERAALKSVSETESGGRIICGKQVISGVTVALAEETWKGTL